MRIIVTGAAGFIGYHLSDALLQDGHEVFGYDSVNDYYDPTLKEARLSELESYRKFEFSKGLLEDMKALSTFWEIAKPDVVVHLAAQAGVRYSLSNPMAYISSNIVGFQHVIELVRKTQPRNFLYASSSSVYGNIKEKPFSETMDTRVPVSLYAASKIANEVVAASYAHLYNIPSIGFRFFTVYGTFSRPDMAMFKFAEKMREGKPIEVYNEGRMVRDFTFVSDIVDGLMSAIDRPMVNQVFNLGAGSPVVLSDMIDKLEQELNLKAYREYLPIQPGDVPETIADINKAVELLGYDPKVDINVGIANFAKWYKRYRNIA